MSMSDNLAVIAEKNQQSSESQLERQKDVAKKLYEIGDKFASVAISNSSIRNAKMAFEVAERAYRFAFELDATFNRDSISSIEFVYIFLSGVEDIILRSSLWRCYVSFCENNSILPLTKSEFFKTLDKLDFRVRKSQGDMQVVPPKVKPTLLLDAAEKRRLLMDGLIDQSSS